MEEIEDRFVRSVLREMGIRENYEGEITPIRSNISRFSRDTVALRRPSATCFLILVRLKFTAVNVILVDRNIRLRFLRQIIQRENGRHRTNWHTGAAINALCGIDV